MANTRLKPLVNVHRRALLLRRPRGPVLSRELESLIFAAADVLSEGGARGVGMGQSTYFGSTMLAVEYASIEREGGVSLSAAQRRELVRAVEGSVRVRLRAMRLARAEAARRVPSSSLGTVMCEVRVNDRGDQLHIDVDLEAEVRVSSRAKRS